MKRTEMEIRKSHRCKPLETSQLSTFSLLMATTAEELLLLLKGVDGELQMTDALLVVVCAAWFSSTVNNIQNVNLSPTVLLRYVMMTG